MYGSYGVGAPQKKLLNLLQKVEVRDLRVIFKIFNQYFTQVLVIILGFHPRTPPPPPKKKAFDPPQPKEMDSAN